MRGIVASTGWICAVAAWVMAAFLPLQSTGAGGAIAVAFPPWVTEANKVEAMVAADLFIVEKSGPLTFVGYTPTDFNGRKTLQARGALFVLERSSFSLCTPTKSEDPSSNLISEI
ncbi:MAG: hypothetical protein AAF830_10555 [Pseudomonadota bacterium]